MGLEAIFAQRILGINLLNSVVIFILYTNFHDGLIVFH